MFNQKMYYMLVDEACEDVSKGVSILDIKRPEWRNIDPDGLDIGCPGECIIPKLTGKTYGKEGILEVMDLNQVIEAGIFVPKEHLHQKEAYALRTVLFQAVLINPEKSRTHAQREKLFSETLGMQPKQFFDETLAIAA